MPITFKKPPLLPSLLTAASVVILVGLGSWQAQKYIAKSEGRSGICAQDIVQIQNSDFDNFSGNPQAACPNKVTLRGYVLPQPVVPVGPRMHDGKGGYNLYLPLHSASDDTAIMVNMGWSEAPNISWTDGFSSDQPIAITGSVVTPKSKSMFTLDNNPEQNEWYSLQTEEIKTHFGIEGLSAYIFQAASVEPVAIHNFTPAPLSKLYLTPETHLQYASFWYCMALALMVIFALRFAIVLPLKRAQ